MKISRLNKPFCKIPLTISYFYLSMFLLFMPCFCIFLFISSSVSYAQDDLLKIVEKKQTELKDRENQLRQEEKRIETLRKDLDERIAKYTKILAQIESLLKKIEQIKDQNFEQIVRTYEAMPPEDAAIKLSALDEELAVKIISKMKYKKAAAIMALMDTKKATNITQSMNTIEKKFPTR